MDAAHVDVLQAELTKALKRRDEQARVLDNNRRILTSPGMEQLKAVARRRMPKLTEVYEETLKIIVELQQALAVNEQPSLPFEEASPPAATSAPPEPSPDKKKAR